MKRVKIERYKQGRHWAVYDREGLVAVTVYKKGALAVAERISMPRSRSNRRKPCRR